MFGFIRLCSSYEKFFLKSLVAEFRRTGVEESSFKNVNQSRRFVCDYTFSYPLALTVSPFSLSLSQVYEQLDGLLRVLGKFKSLVHIVITT